MVRLNQMVHPEPTDRNGALMIALQGLYLTAKESVRRLDAVVAEMEKKADRNEKAA